MHLYGWRKADEYYARAYAMIQSPELRDKRFLTLCLTAIREKDERIVNPATYEKLDALGEFTKTPKQQYFTGLLQHYRTAPVLRSGDPKLRSQEKRAVNISLFDIQNSALEVMAFLTVPKSQETLRPKVMFPLPYGMGDPPVKAFTEELKKKGITTIVRSYRNRGDRFNYKPQ